MAFLLKTVPFIGSNYANHKIFVACKSSSKRLTFYTSRRSLIGTVKHHSKKEKPLSSTSIIVQDGHSILEMPCIVQVINGEFKITSNGKTSSGEPYIGMGLECNQVPKTLFKKIDFHEESEMTLGFMRCNTIKEVFNLLNTCPEEEVTPSVALAVIRRIFDLENNLEYRNQGINIYSEESNFTFTRSALIKRLLETICASTECQIIVDALRSLGRDPNKADKANYVEQICTECIILATDGKLTANQVCELIKAFHNLGDIGKNYIEKVWVGINEKTKELDVDELCNILSILPRVKNSRIYLYNIVEKKLPLVWFKLESEHIIRIIYILVQLKLSSNRLLGLISRWTNLNIHNLTEGNLRWIVYAFLSLEYTDDNIQHAISRYMKAKKINIKDHSLVSVILNYCNKLRIRHPTILSFGAEYFVEHAKAMPASQIGMILSCFGNLNFLPAEPQVFFQILESRIDENFSHFPPDELLDVFLACIYLERYPLNFVRKVFHPHFLDRLHSVKDNTFLNYREKLLIMDTLMTVECSGYSGPILPKTYHPKNITRDARVLRCMNKLKPSLVDIVKNEDKISHSVFLPSLPPIGLFVIDFVIDATRTLNFGPNNDLNKFAILIHPPQHFDLTEKSLLGPQEMKDRLLKHFGFKVVHLNYQSMNKLFMYPNKLKEYLLQEMANASNS